jgi:hypothetical protein
LTARSPCSTLTGVRLLRITLTGLLLVAGLFALTELIPRVLDLPALRGARVALWFAAIAAMGLWLAVVLFLRLSRQPPDPAAGPRSADLGPEPPAVANLLVNDFDVEREAVPATLLDLAARRVIDLEEAGGRVQCRLRDASGHRLAPFEERVLALLRRRASDGVVPAGALTTGPKERSGAWWSAFRNEVIDWSQQRGLSRDLWDGHVLRWLTLGAAPPAILLYLAAANAAPVIAFALGLEAMKEWARGRRRQRETGAGLAAASRWVGVRRYLAEGAFPDLPPTAVIVWERYLAYAAALGIAPAAVSVIPMGADEDHRAWSAHGGEWRLVRVRYPRMWPTAWGWRPWVAIVASVVGFLASFVALRLAASIGWPPAGPADPAGLMALVRGLFAFFLAIGTGAGLWSLVTVVRALLDTGSPEEVRGLVLRIRTFGRSNRSPGRHYVALDDGRSPVIRAWRIRPELVSRTDVSEYEEAAATVTPQLRFVDDLRRA